MKLKGFRTILWNVLALFSFAAIFHFVPQEFWNQAIALHASIFAVGNMGLRMITNTKVGKAE